MAGGESLPPTVVVESEGDAPHLAVLPASAEGVPEGRVVDFLTGKHVKDTPEEYVRQNIEKALVKQYLYEREDCVPELRIQFGSSKPRVDIAVFPAGAKHTQENAWLLIECKKP